MAVEWRFVVRFRVYERNFAATLISLQRSGTCWHARPNLLCFVEPIDLGTKSHKIHIKKICVHACTHTHIHMHTTLDTS